MTRATPKTTTAPEPSGFDGIAAAISPKWQEAVLRLARKAELVAARMPAAYARPDNVTLEHVQEVRDLIDRLIDYIDGMEPDPDLEPSLGSEHGSGSDECEASGDEEPSLGSFDRMADQSKSWRSVQGEVCCGTDTEQDDCDKEDSDPAEESKPSGIGDSDGLVEQIGKQDWQPIFFI